MPRVKRADQLALLGPRRPEGKTRYYLGEVAHFLLIGVPSLAKWAEKERLLHRNKKSRVSDRELRWLTEWGMRRAVLHFRYDIGRDYVQGGGKYRPSKLPKDDGRRRWSKPWELGPQEQPRNRFRSIFLGQKSTYWHRTDR